MRILLTDLNADLVRAWQQAFQHIELQDGHSVEFHHRDIFAAPGDIIVSPANSFGFMDGGIDAVYTRRFGSDLQAALQEFLKPHGELLIGQAVILETLDDQFRWLISAPTMRVPSPIKDPLNVYLATRAAIGVALSMDRQSSVSVIMPGMGTYSGKVPVDIAARQMAKGIFDALYPPPFPQSWREAYDRQMKEHP